MDSKIMVTIPCQFSSSGSSNKCHVCLLAKSIVWVLPPGGLSKVPNSPKVPASLAMGFLEKKNTSLCGIACVPGDWEDATRFVLVVSFWYRRFSLCKRPHTHTLHTIHTHTHSTVKESCLAWFVVADHEEGEAEVRRTSRACCFVWEDVPFWNCRLFTTSCFDFSTMFESLLKQELHKSALEHSWWECSSSTSRLMWSRKTPLRSCRSSCCRENI